MAYLGLIPSEDSSGPRRRQGRITKAGNRSARRAQTVVAIARELCGFVWAIAHDIKPVH